MGIPKPLADSRHTTRRSLRQRCCRHPAGRAGLSSRCAHRGGRPVGVRRPDLRHHQRSSGPAPDSRGQEHHRRHRLSHQRAFMSHQHRGLRAGSHRRGRRPADGGHGVRAMALGEWLRVEQSDLADPGAVAAVVPPVQAASRSGRARARGPGTLRPPYSCSCAQAAPRVSRMLPPYGLQGLVSLPFVCGKMPRPFAITGNYAVPDCSKVTRRGSPALPLCSLHCAGACAPSRRYGARSRLGWPPP